MATPYISSISQIEKPIDENKRTAIFYSISDIAELLVEIRHHGKYYFISTHNKPKRFGNLGEAISAALDHAAEDGFLALNNTYQEVDSNLITNNKRYDYVHINLKEA